MKRQGHHMYFGKEYKEWFPDQGALCKYALPAGRMYYGIHFDILVSQ